MGFLFDMQFVSPAKKNTKPDLRKDYLMLAAYITQLSKLSSSISIQELRSSLNIFFDEQYLNQRFTFYMEMLRQRIPVDQVCEHINLYATDAEKISLLKFLITFSEKSRETTNRLKAIYYVMLRLKIKEEQIQSFFHQKKEKQNSGEQKQYSYTNQNNSIKKYFDMLSVTEQATYSDVKKAYYRLAKKYHPDSNIRINANQKELNEKFAQITNAYEKIKEYKRWK